MVSTGLPPELIERLGRDHAKISGVVRRIEALADVWTGQPEWGQLAELIDFLRYFADQVHHPLEDRAFDLVVNRGLTPTERHLLFRNLNQHQEIRTFTDSLAEQIRVARSGGTVDSGDFQRSLAAYVALQRSHMRFEERHLFQLLESVLDDRDWIMPGGILDEPPAGQTDEEPK